ncbi:MAG: hypothetical protein RLZZ129_2638 [Verrucomicrobiota bacterium]|jgi:hypothetical protein
MNDEISKSEGEKVLENVRQMNTGKLLEWMAGKKESGLDVWVGRYELERRKAKWSEIRAWVTIAISVAALTVSIIALVEKGRG